jgi:hypothetical protein
LTKRIVTLLSVWLLASQCLGQITSCPGYNHPSTTINWGNSGGVGHSSGQHDGAAVLTGSCAYTSIGQSNCATACSADAEAAVNDNGTISNPLYVHEITKAVSPGFSNSNGGAASCGSLAAWTATSCLATCSIAITINTTSNGVGATASFPSTNLSFNTSVPDTTNCIANPDPTYLSSITVSPSAASAAVGATQQFTALGTYADGSTKTLTNALWTSSSPGVATIGGGSGLATGIAVGTTTITASSSGRTGAATLSVTSGGEGGGGSSGSGGGSCNGGGCGGSGGGNSCGSPIIIDAYGEGFHMTDVADGVLFDIRGDGHPIDMGWTARGYHNAFLALDRNGNGKIDNGEELFGNYTPQPKSKDANGYAALAEFDKPENGGNADGVINEKDAIYSKLLLWIDENHDGISQPNELHHLWELGVFSLSLKYVDTPHRDGFGNWFRYKGKINPLGEPGPDPVDRTSYDVFFELQAPGPRPPACE